MKYIVAPSSNYLAHSFKYIDKVYKNGKWRYIYNRAANKIRNAGNNIKDRLNDQAKSAKKNINKLSGKAGYTMRDLQEQGRKIGYKTNKAGKAALNKGKQILKEDKDFYGEVGSKISKAAKGVAGDIGRAVRKGKTTNKGNTSSQYTPGYSKERTKKIQNLENMNRRKLNRSYSSDGTDRTATNANVRVANHYNNSTNVKSSQYSPTESRKTRSARYTQNVANSNAKKSSQIQSERNRHSAINKANAQYEASKKQSAERSAHYATTAGGKREATRNAISSYEERRKRKQRLGTTRKKNVTSGSVSASRHKNGRVSIY